MGRHGLTRTTIAVPVGIALAVGVALFIAGCGGQPGTSTTIDLTAVPQADPSLPARVAVMQAPQADVAEAVASNNAFSADLFKAVRVKNQNLVCSP
jgi:hypothetical protein